MIYIADYYKKCIPGVAVEGISAHAIFTTRREAIRWAKFSARFEIDWATWKAPQGVYPEETARDDEQLSPTFIAKVGNWPETEEVTVTVTKSQVREVFDWWAKSADGSWNTEPVEYPSSPQVEREQMLQDLALQLDLALGELRLIDEALARRPALDDLGPKQRYEKIMRMCQFAGLGHDKAKQLPVGSEVKPRTQPCKHGILPPWECKDCMYEEVTPRTGEGS